MKIITLLTLMAATYFVARGNHEADCASVIAADGWVWNNVRMDALVGPDHPADFARKPNLLTPKLLHSPLRRAVTEAAHSRGGSSIYSF
jgi:hypothetical protein